jgi:hypothetical protein
MQLSPTVSLCARHSLVFRFGESERHEGGSSRAPILELQDSGSDCPLSSDQVCSANTTAAI